MIQFDSTTTAKYGLTMVIEVQVNNNSKTIHTLIEYVCVCVCVCVCGLLVDRGRLRQRLEYGETSNAERRTSNDEHGGAACK